MEKVDSRLSWKDIGGKHGAGVNGFPIRLGMTYGEVRFQMGRGKKTTPP